MNIFATKYGYSIVVDEVLAYRLYLSVRMRNQMQAYVR